MKNYRKHHGPHIVRFIAPCQIWQANDLAGFDKEAYDDLLARGLATPYQDPDKKAKRPAEKPAKDNTPTAEEVQKALKAEAEPEKPRRKKRTYRRKTS